MNEKAKAWFQGWVVFKGSGYSGNFLHTSHSRHGQTGGSDPGGGHNAVGIRPQADADEKRQAIEDHRLARQLATQPMTVQKDADYQPGVFDSAVVQVEGDGRAIVKPNGQLKRQVRNDTTHAEALAYEASVRMGYPGMIPPTVRREHGGEPVSAQAWVEDAQLAATMKSWKGIDRDSYRQMLLVDGVMGNWDRHSGNFLVGKGGKVIGIDNGFAFGHRGLGTAQNQVWGRDGWAQSYWKRLGGGPFAFTAQEIGRVKDILADADFQGKVKKALGDKAWQRVAERGQELVKHGTEPWW